MIRRIDDLPLVPVVPAVQPVRRPVREREQPSDDPRRGVPRDGESRNDEESDRSGSGVDELA